MQQEKEMKKTDYVQDLVGRLSEKYPEATTALHFSNPLEILVATILSAQCTDEQVNKVTPKLFAKYPQPQDYFTTAQEELEKDIHSTGFYRNKARAIQGATRMIVEKFGAQVPKTMEELLQLPGVARKTANCVLGNAYGIISGIVVDTHVLRLAGRLGLSKEKNAEKVEADLMKLIARENWIIFAHLLIDHGRALCKARNPLCSECFLNDICPSAFKV
jgi:endonuclease III